VVDVVIGEHQTVIKSLGSMYRGVEGLSGATILGSGAVALILDVPKLISMVCVNEGDLCVPADG
jgi:two-component system, chemotaxis family, sensor kinase CheA